MSRIQTLSKICKSSPLALSLIGLLAATTVGCDRGQNKAPNWNSQTMTKLNCKASRAFNPQLEIDELIKQVRESNNEDLVVIRTFVTKHTSTEKKETVDFYKEIFASGMPSEVSVNEYLVFPVAIKFQNKDCASLAVNYSVPGIDEGNSGLIKSITDSSVTILSENKDKKTKTEVVISRVGAANRKYERMQHLEKQFQQKQGLGSLTIVIKNTNEKGVTRTTEILQQFTLKRDESIKVDRSVLEQMLSFMPNQTLALKPLAADIVCASSKNESNKLDAEKINVLSAVLNKMLIQEKCSPKDTTISLKASQLLSLKDLSVAVDESTLNTGSVGHTKIERAGGNKLEQRYPPSALKAAAEGSSTTTTVASPAPAVEEAANPEKKADSAPAVKVSPEGAMQKDAETKVAPAKSIDNKAEVKKSADKKPTNEKQKNVTTQSFEPRNELRYPPFIP